MSTSRACWLPSLVKFVTFGEAQYQYKMKNDWERQLMSTSDTHKLGSCDDQQQSTYVYHCRAVLCQDVPQFVQKASNGHLSY